jgi:hypothetical protein
MMRGCALVIGAADRASADGPSAAELDAVRMTELLGPRGFDVKRLAGRDATRDRILEEYERLIARAEGRAAVVYFAGHGGTAIDDEGGAPGPRLIQYIVPSDYDESTEDDFRAITSDELSLLLAQLTGKTHNVTVILDCCHSAQMSRGDAALGEPRAVDPVRRRLRRHLEAVRDRRGRIEQLPPTGNPHAVRVVACGEWQQAFTKRDERGPTGMLTSALLATLREIGDAPISWRAIGAAIRARVLRQCSTQMPMIEGPVKRRPFSLCEVDASAIPIAGGGDGLRLGRGRISGVTKGDVYGVAPLAAAGFDPATAIARVQVEHTAAVHAIGRPIAWLNGHTAVPEGAVAWPLELALARQPVRVVAAARERPALAAAVAASARLRVADEDEGAIAELSARGGELGVVTADGVPLSPESGAWTRPSAIRQLEHLAAAQALRELSGEGIDAGELEVEWGTVHGGARVSRPAHRAAVSEGDRIYVALRNRASEPRFAHVFNIGVRGRITRLSAVAESGIRLGPRGGGQHEALVGPRGDPAAGFEMCWPAGVPRDAPAIDRLVVLATAAPADLRGLETDDEPGARGLEVSDSPLRRRFAQLHGGGTRRGAGAGGDERFLVVQRSWMLHPLRAPVALAGFAVDEDPTDMRGVNARDAWLGGGGAARPLAIRLRDVEVTRRIRLDALICTRSADRARTYEARTLRLAAGAAGAAGALWDAPVRDLVEIFLWASPDGGEQPPLAALLADELAARPELAEAQEALLVSDEGAPWALAAGACAALANAADARLRAALPDAAGLAHASFAVEDLRGSTPRYRGHGVALTLELAPR